MDNNVYLGKVNLLFIIGRSILVTKCVVLSDASLFVIVGNILQ